MSSERVRAILINDDDHMLAIKRIKPAQPPYWVLPGGGVEPGETLEDALGREIREELAGHADICSLIHITTGPRREHFYLGRIHAYDFDQRTGPEFTAPGRGEYHLQAIPLALAPIKSITLLPPQIHHLITDHLASGASVFDLPDLRLPHRQGFGVAEGQAR